MNRIKRIVAAVLLAATSVIGFGSVTNPASAVTATNFAGQSGTVTWNPGAEVFCTKYLGQQNALLNTYITVLASTPIVGHGVVVDETVYARAWVEWWDVPTGRWVHSGRYLNNNAYASGPVQAVAGYHNQARLNTGSVWVTSPYHERVGYEVWWRNNKTGIWTAHKYYYASANEYRVTTPSTGTVGSRNPYCYI